MIFVWKESLQRTERKSINRTRKSFVKSPARESFADGKPSGKVKPTTPFNVKVKPATPFNVDEEFFKFLSSKLNSNEWNSMSDSEQSALLALIAKFTNSQREFPFNTIDKVPSEKKKSDLKDFETRSPVASSPIGRY